MGLLLMGGKRTNARGFGEDGDGEGKARGRKEKKMEGRRRPPPTIFGLEAPLT